jgi:ABC-type transporter Mla maintaining outer membrane lipid asymmetry ATPase subunit MlaF
VDRHIGTSRNPLVVEIAGLVKHYQGLRPLRVADLQLRQGERLSVLGVDAASAEVLVNLLTGASLPDQGKVSLFGEDTAAIQSADQWLPRLDRIGLVSARSVLLEALSVAQNLAMPMTLDLDPIPDETMAVVVALAEEISLPPSSLNAPVGGIDSDARARLLLGRALTLGPALLVLEHPSASLPDEPSVSAFGATVSSVAAARGLAVLSLTADVRWPPAMGGLAFALEPATGALKPRPVDRALGRRRWWMF